MASPISFKSGNVEMTACDSILFYILFIVSVDFVFFLVIFNITDIPFALCDKSIMPLESAGLLFHISLAY